MGLPFKTLEPYRPWFASLTISVMQIIAAGGDPEAGVEMILGKEAEALGRERRFFETNEEQIRFFADLPDKVASEMLIESIKQTRAQPNYFNDLVSAWKTGNTDELGKLLNEAMDESDPVLADTLLYNRNKKWAATLKDVLENEEGIFFVAVGAGHLAGDKKVQDYLLELGITTERL